MSFFRKNKTKILWIILIGIILAATYMCEESSYNEQRQINSASEADISRKASDKEKTSVESVEKEQAKLETKKAEPEEISKDESREASVLPQAEPEEEKQELLTVKDMYDKEPAIEGKPKPIEPQNVTVSDKEMNCTLTIRCDVIHKNMEKLPKEKIPLVPENGIILDNLQVKFFEGESVFNVLLRETRRNKIHMEYVSTPMYNSAYIEGINNLYEFDCGNLSGWMYSVNGWFPNYGSSRYQLCDGDRIEWVYTCDLGRDIK